MCKLLLVYTYMICVLYSNALSCEGGDVNPTNLFTIARIGGGGGPVYDYLIEGNRILVQESWSPGDKPFPLDLWRESEHLRPLIGATKGITEGMSLNEVLIRPMHILGPMASGGVMSKDLTNQWYVTFDWVVGSATTNGNEARIEHAVVLLDGTVATRIPATSTNLVDREDLSYTDPGAAIWRARLMRMQSKSRALLSRVDLRVGSAVASKYVTEHLGALPDVKLENILLKFGLVGSVSDDDEEEIAAASQWTARYFFAGATKMYEVDTLYDGTVVSGSTLTHRH